MCIHACLIVLIARTGCSNRYKKLARKWHPDKAKGQKKRAARKMNDVAEAKTVMDKQSGCGRHKNRSGRD